MARLAQMWVLLDLESEGAAKGFWAYLQLGYDYLRRWEWDLGGYGFKEKLIFVERWKLIHRNWLLLK